MISSYWQSQVSEKKKQQQSFAALWYQMCLCQIAAGLLVEGTKLKKKELIYKRLSF